MLAPKASRKSSEVAPESPVVLKKRACSPIARGQSFDHQADTAQLPSIYAHFAGCPSCDGALARGTELTAAMVDGDLARRRGGVGRRSNAY
jgi:hypothetical protein